MQDVLREFEVIIINEMKKRTGLKSAWNIMGIHMRKDFLDRISSKFTEVLEKGGITGTVSDAVQEELNKLIEDNKELTIKFEEVAKENITLKNTLAELQKAGGEKKQANQAEEQKTSSRKPKTTKKQEG